MTLAAAVAFQCGGEPEEAPASSATPSEKSASTEPVAESEEQLLAAMRLQERDFPLLVWSAYRVSLDYYDPTRFDAPTQIESALEFMGLHTPEFLARVEGGAIEVTIGAEKRRFELGSPRGVRDAVEVLEPILVFARDTLDLSGEPVHELEYAAINGLLAPLDSHTILLTPEQHADLGVKTRGRFGGIGARIGVKDRRIEVGSVIPDSPADRAGLKAGDVMLKITGQSTVNMTPGEAQELLRGPVDTEVVVEVRRGDDRITIRIVRGMIKIASVVAARLSGDVGYMRIRQFQQDTAERFEAELRTLMDEPGIRGLVIDLRGNEGGLLTQATKILDLMVDGGELVIVRSASGREHEDATPDVLLGKDVPVVALVDQGSASAAEIVAGGIKHLARGVVVGRGSFGKGSVQMLKPWDPYGRELALKTTVAEYRVAGERRIQTSGVLPDVRLHPVQLADVEGVGQMFDLERFERQRQRSIIAAMPAAKHEIGEAFAPASKHLVRFISGPPISPGDSPERDAEVRLARDFALAAEGATGRRTSLEAIVAAVPKIAAREDAEVGKAIGARWPGLDGAWGSSAAANQTPLTVNLDRVDARGEVVDPTQTVGAGAAFDVRVRVRNDGDAVVERVHLITDCPHDEIDGIEVLLGRIEPGATAEQTLTLAMATFRPDLHSRLRVAAHVGEPDARPDGEAELGIDLSGGPRPAFALDWWIVDDPALARSAPSRPAVELLPGDEAFRVRGNGDGNLQPGEHVLVAFALTNHGPGASPRASVVVRNLSGRQGLLEEGQVPIGSVPPRETVRGAFGLTVSDEPLPQLPLELQLTAGDAIMRERVTHKVRLPIGPLGEPAPSVKTRKGTVRAMAESVVRAAARADAPIMGSIAAGTPMKAVATAPGFVGVALEGKRRGWVADTAVDDGGGGARPLELAPAIDPPQIELSEIPRSVDAPTLELRGVARHLERVRDVVIWVRAEGAHSRDRKVWYGANTDTGSSWSFSGSVPLEPGTNRIRVIARDGDRVERWQDLWVHRGG
jgi:carboxyl-terminal processing protease